MTSQVDKLSIKVDGLDNKVDNLSTQVDGFSTKLEEFASNLTDFTKITNTNSASILTVIEMFKGHALQVPDIKTVDELSKKYKNILDIVRSNSKNIEKLSNKIKAERKEAVKLEAENITALKESIGEEVVEKNSLVQSDKEFKEDEEPTARMIELVTSFTVDKVTEFLSISSSGEIIFKELFKSQPEGRGPYAGSLIPAYSTAAISFYNREGEFIRQIAGDTTINPISRQTTPFNVHRGMCLIDNGYLHLKIIDDQIYIKVEWHQNTPGSEQYGYQVFSMTGEFIKYIDDRKKDLLVTNRGIIKKSVLDLINNYDKSLGYIISSDSTSKFKITKNGEIYIIKSDLEYNKQITVFDSEGTFIRKFLLSKNYSNSAYSLGSDDNFNIEIFENELFIIIKSNIYVYNLSGEFQYKFNYGVEFTKESIFISDKRPDRSLINFKVTNSGDFCIVFRNHNHPSMGIKIYKKGTMNFFIYLI